MTVRWGRVLIFGLCFLDVFMRVNTFKVASKGNKAPSPSPSSPSPSPPSSSSPACTVVGSDVSVNMQSLNLCPSSCRVVVNHAVSDAASCAVWSASAFWDGARCMSRCEAIGGVPVNGTACAVGGGVVVVPFNRSGQVVPLSSVPVRCGTWLGPLDSARADSWFSSACVSILADRFSASSSSRLSQCGASVRTTGCRVMDTNQRWVEACRQTDAAECGVMVPCPASNNPCGLESNFSANMLGDKNNCSAASSRLVVNAALNSTVACDDWTGNAFRHSDGYCVSACDNTADECLLDGKRVPPCVGGSYAHGLCYVSMPVSSETGVRNAFYGLTVNRAFECRVRIHPRCNASAGWCFLYEGLWVGFSFPDYNLPLCNGNVSMDCYVAWPCLDDDHDISNCGFLGISDAMYRELRGGETDARVCGWIKGRDVVTCLLWVVCVVVRLCATYDGVFACECNGCVLVCMLLMLVWEVGLVIICCAFCVFVIQSDRRLLGPDV